MSSARLFAALGAVAVCAAVALGASTPSVQAQAFLPNRLFGLGEQHVYLIERSETLVVRYRDDVGNLVAKTVRGDDRRSMAFTVEGFDDQGAAVLGVATDTASPSLPPQPIAGVPDSSAPPSPSVGRGGNVSVPGPLGDLAQASLVLGGTGDQILSEGSKWSSAGALALPLGPLPVRIANTATRWNGDATMLQINSAGTAEIRRSPRISGFGQATLRGNGVVTGASFVDLSNQLLLGTSFSVTSRGNAVNRNGDTGSYTLSARYTLKLVRYVAGLMITPPPGLLSTALPGLSRSAEPVNNVIRSENADQLAHPAPTNTLMRFEPLPLITPTAGPDVSLPPVPLPVSSDAPLVSPPPPPPTPIATPTPH